MRICFDLDNTLCSGKPYVDAVPLAGAKELLIRLKEKGYIIIIHTARGMGTNSSNVGATIASIGKLTLNQLESWGFIYDEIYFGKPSAEVYIDDKAFHASNLEKLESYLDKMQKTTSRVNGYCSKIEGMMSKIEDCTKD